LIDKNRPKRYKVQIWGKAAIGLYLWEHIFEGPWREGEIDFTPSVSTQAQGHVPLDTDRVVLVLNGQEQQKIPCATRWLQHIQTLMWVDAVNCLAVVLLGSKRCTKGWISIYLRRHGVFVVLLFLVYGSPWVNDKDVFQWPVGVATYVFFSGIWVTANSQMVNSTRPFLCNFLGTETAKSLRRYQTALAQSELTLCPVEIYMDSVPVVEDIVTPGGCSAAHSSPLRLLKAAGALFIFLKDYKELPGLLEKEKGMITLNNATLIMFTYLTLLISYVYTVSYTIYCILPMPLGHRSSIYLYTYSYSIPFDLCVLGSCWGIVRYYCTVGTRSTSISLHLH
uniref:Ribitol xylosyltransferase 1 n=1 Tax=Oncorhynchus tshawytscha TaxID=74940 RepID=A0AAZ3RNB0_ONCTS